MLGLELGYQRSTSVDCGWVECQPPILTARAGGGHQYYYIIFVVSYLEPDDYWVRQVFRGRICIYFICSVLNDTLFADKGLLWGFLWVLRLTPPLPPPFSSYPTLPHPPVPSSHSFVFRWIWSIYLYFQNVQKSLMYLQRGWTHERKDPQ